MMGNVTVRTILVGLVVFITACVTVNIYFPAAEVRQAAEEIARDVRGEETAPSSDSSSAGPQSWLNLVETVHAQQELNISNASIRQIKARMKERYPSLQPFLQQAAVGEGRDGFLVLRDIGGLDLRNRAQVQRLVSVENEDRKALYQAVAEALKIPASEIARVGAIFAGEWQKTAPSGSWSETPSGQWER